MSAFVREIALAELFDHTHQIWQRLCVHFLQYAPAMNLDRDLRDAKLGGNLRLGYRDHLESASAPTPAAVATLTE